MKVNLNVVLTAIKMASDRDTYFLDLETGESVFITDKPAAGRNDGRLATEINDHPERYLRLPTKHEVNEYFIMEEFICTLEEEKAEQFELAIRGRGAFSRFRDLIFKFGVWKEWITFQEEYHKMLAKRWCKENRLEIKYR